MNFIHRRMAHTQNASCAEILIDGKHECYVIEDPPQIKKIPGQTRIPAGTYEITLRTEGGFHKRYSRRFPSMHKGMLWIRNITNFQYCYYHRGNDHKDTRGCPLPVTTLSLSENNFWGGASTDAYIKFYKKLMKFFERNERVYVTIIDEIEG